MLAVFTGESTGDSIGEWLVRFSVLVGHMISG
jgi:hypothetical protein